MALFNQRGANNANGTKPSANANTYGRHRGLFTLMFSWLLLLAILELGFTVDTFQYLQRKHQWQSKQQRQRICFLLFSSFRSVFLAAVYVGSNFANKWFHSLHHTIFLVLNTIFWITGGVLVKQSLGVVECGGVGHIKGGLNECHELKIIEILAWITAASSILITIPIVMWAMERQRNKAERGETLPQKKGWMSRFAFKKDHGAHQGGEPLNEKHATGPTGV